MEHLTEKACTLRRVTYLVLDEADRMFAMGFESQVCLACTVHFAPLSAWRVMLMRYRCRFVPSSVSFALTDKVTLFAFPLDHDASLLICGQCVALLFSATMPRRIEGLARDILRDPIRIAIGQVGAVRHPNDRRV